MPMNIMHASHSRNIDGKTLPHLESFLFGKAFLICSLLLILACMLFLNFKTPLLADDYVYAMHDGRHISSFAEIVDSMRVHYFTWGGRILVHTIAQFFLWHEHASFAIANSLVFTALIILVLAHASILGNFKANGPMALLAFVFIAVFSPRFGQDALWLIGSCNYLWGATIGLLVLLPFSRYASSASNAEHSPSAFISLIFGIIAPISGFIAGFTSEGVGITVIFAQIFALFVAQRRGNRLSKALIACTIAAIAGYLIMMAAPGNFQRLETTHESVSPIEGFLKVLGSYFDPLFLLYPAFIALGVLFLPFRDPGRTHRAMAAALLVLLCSTFCFSISPSYTSRVQLFPCCVAAILILAGIGGYCPQRKKELLFYGLASAMLFAAFCNVMFLAGHDAVHLDRYYQKAYEIIAAAKADPQASEIVIPRKIYFSPTNHFCAGFHLMELTEDPDGDLNKAIANYFGTDKPLKLGH